MRFRVAEITRVFKPPATYLGFPIAAEVENASELGRRRGIAMIIAILVISVMMGFTVDLILSSQVNLQLNVAHRDNLKSEYMVKSGMNLANLLLSADFAWDLAQIQQNPKAAKLNDGLGDFWSVLNGLPIGGETLEMLGSFQEMFDLNRVLDAEVTEQLQLFDGTFVVDVSDESRKININNCAMNKCTETLFMLEALFSCPAEKAFLETKDIDPKELAYKIKDWVDENSKAEPASGVTDEEDPYINRIPKVRPKNAPMDSVEELRMIDGWDEQVHSVFSPMLTVFPLQKKREDKFKINLNTVSREMLVCLFPESREGDCNEKSTLALRDRNQDKTGFGSDGQKVSEILSEMLCYSGDASSGKASNKASWFQKNSMVYRIDVTGTVGDQERKLVAVIERTMPDPKKKKKYSFDILYWKIM